MARFATGLAVVIGAVLVWVAVAQAAVYKGGIKGEPETRLGLTVKKIEGDRYVTRISFKRIPVECNNGKNTSTGEASAGAPGTPGVEIRGGEFRGPWEYGKVSGEATGGKLKGTITLKTDAGPPHGECKSGKLKYVVRD
ncbi:MAG TPA: hypothetical protein VD766_11455 [Solirubrobacterales bacterium]|nr:hypothetical protein [Solirubrobacterales bacterium]